MEIAPSDGVLGLQEGAASQERRNGLTPGKEVEEKEEVSLII